MEGEDNESSRPLSVFVYITAASWRWSSSYLGGRGDAVLDVSSKGKYVGVVGDVFRDLICNRSQEITEELREDNKQ